MILEFDCGNTRIKWRIRDGINICTRGFFLTSEVFAPIVLNEIPASAIKRVLVSSVLDDDYNRKIAEWTLANFNLNPEFASSESLRNGVRNGYLQPEKLGIDRWLAILAAKSKTTMACIVVDCGSAITVDVIKANGDHVGGYIAPGLRLMREALNLKTAAIKLNQMDYPSTRLPGRMTVEAIKAAELAMITGIINEAKMALRSYDESSECVWITGGDGDWLSSVLESNIFVEDLVLDGLSIALE